MLNLGARVASWIPALRILQPQEAAKQVRHVLLCLLIFVFAGKVSPRVDQHDFNFGIANGCGCSQLAAFVNVQSNLSEEALNLERFHHNFKDRDDVTFPRPVCAKLTFLQPLTITHDITPFDLCCGCSSHRS